MRDEDMSGDINVIAGTGACDSLVIRSSIGDVALMTSPPSACCVMRSRSWWRRISRAAPAPGPRRSRPASSNVSSARAR
jgi:hypothetical protein